MPRVILCILDSFGIGGAEDAKRFDGIDAAFREQMADASTNANPIEVCTAEGREAVFQANFEALELCQKSLSDYLEVKKKKFPRFCTSRTHGR